MSDSYFQDRLKNKLQKLPANEARASQDEASVVAAGEQIGFVSRDPEPDIEVRQTLGPVVMMTMRVPVRIARQFKAFCKVNRFSYWEGIEELMKRGGIT
jgi:hypothetical protein